MPPLFKLNLASLQGAQTWLPAMARRWALRILMASLVASTVVPVTSCNKNTCPAVDGGGSGKGGKSKGKKSGLMAPGRRR